MNIMVRDIEDGQTGGGAPAPASNPFGGGSQASDPYAQQYTSEDDLFSGLEDYFSKQEEVNDPKFEGFQISQQRKDPNGQPQDRDPNGQPQEEFKAMKLQVGDREVEIKSKEVLTEHVKRSHLAGELYQEYGELKKQYEDIKGDFDELQRLSAEDPLEFLNIITAKLEVDKVSKWMEQKISYWKLDDQQRDQYEQYMQGQKAIRQQALLQQRMEQLEQAERSKRADDDRRQLESFHESLLNQYNFLDKEWVTRVVSQQVQLAQQIQARGKDVSLPQFKKMVQDIIDPIARQLKPQQNPMGALRGSTNPGAVRPQAIQQSTYDKMAYDESLGFEYLENLLNS